MHTFVPVNNRRVGNGLRIWHVYGFSSLKAHVILRWDGLNSMFCYILKFNMPGGANKGTGTTGHADICLNMERCIHFHFYTAPGQAEGTVSHALADSYTEPTENTIIVFLFKTRLFDVILRCEFFDNLHIRTAGK
ncbi:hypothetical protein ES703_85489 [subsurface metagenome]